MPLTMAGIGEIRQIRKVGGLGETKRHLENLGFVEGGQVVVVSDTDGNVIVQVRGARVALGKELACKIIV